MIADETIVSADLKDGAAVRSSDIVDGQVNTADLANNAVTSDKIREGAVTSQDVADGTITSIDLAPGTIPPPSSGSGTPDDNSVTSAKIADGEVKSVDIGDGEVNTEDLADGAVTQSKIASDAIQLNIHRAESERITIPGNLNGPARADCPPGEILTGGGFSADPSVRMSWSYPEDENTWFAGGQNPAAGSQRVSAFALCATISP